ncbi:uncharacterized protein [Argopecten irradians]|uniref:uncharacterized protein n=1 Tax=Argopecten irradians TaxID=31199 RepID=UPI00371DA3EE
MTHMATTGKGATRSRSRPDQHRYVVPAKRNIEKLIKDQQVKGMSVRILNTNDNSQVTVDSPPPSHRQRHVTFKEPLEVVLIIAEPEDSLSHLEKHRRPSGDSGIGSLSHEMCIEDNIRFSSDIACYSASDRKLLTKAHADMCSLSEEERRDVLITLLSQVWSNEGLEERTAYTCSCLIQREVDHENSFCREVETGCSSLIQDSGSLKGQVHQWNKFIIFLHHLSCNIKCMEFHKRVQCLVSSALDITLALLQL